MSTFGRLERRPEAQVFQLDDLLTDLRQGKLRLPKFQRPFRWIDEDRRRFFDSIYRGYPVGSLLLWKRAAPADILHVAGLDLEVPERSDALYIVDGQQRIVTLALSLLRAEERTGRRALYFDTVAGEVKLGNRRVHPPSTWMPVWAARDPVSVVNWLREVALTDQSGESAQEFAKRVQQARLPAYVIETGEETVVRRIFERLNTHGRTLSAPEVFDALHGSFNTKQPSTVRELTQSIADEGFGRLEEQDVLGAVFAIHSGQPLRKLEDALSATSPGEFADKILAAEPILRRVIRFLQADAGIPHRKLLPYASIFPILALFFARHPEPHERSRQLLSRWLYRGATTAAHRGDRVATRQSFEAIGTEEHASVQRLLRTTPTKPANLEILGKFDARYAMSRVELLVLADLAPRDFESGEPIDVAALCDLRGEASTQIVKVAVRRFQQAGTLANRLVHSAAPSSRLVQMISVNDDDDILRSHAVPRAAQKALRDGNVELFLDARAAGLQAVVDEFLLRRAAWGAVDAAPVEALEERA